ncbi:hypothetical protein ACQV5M_06320 [Leptospira sp. SA-E8]|uniref:hypothetical protein n=1 Tax=Leptospira sp. SA-E8 TaxID=3422259 RepID=UPI003EBCFF66
MNLKFVTKPKSKNLAQTNRLPKTKQIAQNKKHVQKPSNVLSISPESEKKRILNQLKGSVTELSDITLPIFKD